MCTIRLTTYCTYEVINPYVSLAGLALMMHQPPVQSQTQLNDISQRSRQNSEIACSRLKHL